MKNVALLFCFIFLLTSAGCAQHPIAKITVHAVNQDGKPINDVEIEAAFLYGHEESIKAYPTDDGYVTFESPVLAYAVVSHSSPYHPIWNPGVDKYYSTLILYEFTNFAENVKDGKWMPWNPTIELVLKERLNPIAMYASDEKTEIKIPLLNQWIGYDFEKDDWVAPYGVGSYSDIEVFYQWDGQIGRNYKGSTLMLRFPDQQAGCYQFQFAYDRFGRSQSSFRSPYNANPNETYSSELIFPTILESVPDPINIGKEKKVFKSTKFANGTGYIFRTRTVVDENGELINAQYGKLYPPSGNLVTRFSNGKALLHLHYYLNPTENDTNLEYDPKHNLFMDKVKPSERWKYQNIAP